MPFEPSNNTGLDAQRVEGPTAASLRVGEVCAWCQQCAAFREEGAALRAQGHLLPSTPAIDAKFKALMARYYQPQRCSCKG